LGKKKTHRIRSSIGDSNKTHKQNIDLTFLNVEYKSMLEVNMANKLHNAGLLKYFEYERKTFIISKYKRVGVKEYVTVNGRLVKSKKPFVPSIKITPDFFSRELGVIIEVKGNRNIDSKFKQKWGLFKLFLDSHDEEFMLVMVSSLEAMDDLIKILKEKEYGNK